MVGGYLDAAAFCPLAFDLYGRPSEILPLAVEHAAPPVGKYKRWPLIFGPLELGLPTKTGLVHDAVMIRKHARSWVAKLLQQLVQKAE